MHCDRCNVDFPEGLRYCKWCGEALVDRPRITSELHSCPSCAAAIQPGWTFCKACGERLQGAARKLVECPGCGAENEGAATRCSRCGEDLTGARAGAESADSSVKPMCVSCGERLDTGSLYCKGCGSAVYTEQTPFGGSALLCGACNSYSPIGSRSCRVCGAALAQGARTVVDFPSGLTTVQQKAPTLPDLDEQMTAQMTAQAPPGTEGEPRPESGANTLIFAGPGAQVGPPIPKGTVETNMLPGTAGARSEQQAPTQVMQMGRITGPVESNEGQEAPNPSGDLTSSPPATDAEASSINQAGIAGDSTVEFGAVSQPSLEPDPDTLGLGSKTESESALAGSENKTAVFVSRPQEALPASREQTARDDIGTRQFTPMPPSPAIEATREFQQPAEGMTGDHLAQTGRIASAPQSMSAPTSAPLQSEPLPQVASQPAPRKRTGMIVASVVVVLILLGAAGYVAWLLLGRGKTAPPQAPPVALEQPPATPAPVAPETPPAPVVPAGMVAIATGTYTIGRDGADPLEQPEHKVDLPAFFIDRAEVTNAAYKMFVDATGHKPPSNWTGTSFPEGRDDFPVTGVTWQDAADYAAWAGKRLPTEVEWEAAARGTDGRIYPWGNGFRSGVANIGSRPDKPTPEQYPAAIRAVGRYPDGASPAGAVDMIGNAWEWVADEIKVYPGNTESKLDLESGVTHRVIRGGAYDGSKANDATYRGYLDGSLPYPKVGFRCAKDAK